MVCSPQENPKLRWLETFLSSGTRVAAEAQAEITQARGLFTVAHEAAGMIDTPPRFLSDTPDAGFEYIPHTGRSGRSI